jgi:CelD/BcsL family acetyltransferase involved in cellulose biosynthesis
MVAPWEALARRAEPNVFMHPAALIAAAASGAVQHVLTAWEGDTLVGFWGLRERRVAPFFSLLAAPPYEYCFVSNPVIDPAHADAVMPAFLDAIERHPALPRVLRLKAFDASGESHQALLRALGDRHGRTLTLGERERPFLNHEGERKRSGSTGKKLRQDWNRLSALGAVDIANDRTAAGAQAAFETFLELEVRSWKGASGTALLSDGKSAAFARALIGNLGAHGAASVALLRVAERPIAAQVLLYAGAMAYTWKTAFDAEFAKYSPGALLIDKASDDLFAHGVAAIESCSTDGGFMAQLWSGRRNTVDMLIDVGAARSATFALALSSERAYVFMREQRKRLRAVNWPALPKRKSLAVTRS